MPSQELIDAIIDMKRRNSRFGCPRIVQEIINVFGVDFDKDVVRRIIGFGVHTVDVDGVALCRMFNTAILTKGVPNISALTTIRH